LLFAIIVFFPKLSKYFFGDYSQLLRFTKSNKKLPDWEITSIYWLMSSRGGERHCGEVNHFATKAERLKGTRRKKETDGFGSISASATVSLPNRSMQRLSHRVLISLVAGL